MFRLALALGRSVAELEHSLSSSELTEWAAYYKMEPFGAERDNWHMAQLCSLFANAHRKRNSAAISPDQFMYRDRDTHRQKSTVGFLSGLKALGKRKAKDNGN